MQETKSRFLWVGLVLGFLILQLCISAVAVVLATGNPSAGVVDDYYQQGLSWDEMKAAQLKSDQLEWMLDELTLGAGDVFGKRTLQFVLLNKENQPVTGCQIEAKLYHHAAASHVLEPDFAEKEPGLYSTTVQMRRSGLWALKLKAQTEQDLFLHSEDIRMEK